MSEKKCNVRISRNFFNIKKFNKNDEKKTMYDKIDKHTFRLYREFILYPSTLNKIFE